ncbi:MAG: DUF1553 domain-containing protein [Verrucomicrobia bacterium]|nr:DUF1553 domain-containing protein [Verrucomicrobiota bacterium]
MRYPQIGTRAFVLAASAFSLIAASLAADRESALEVPRTHWAFVPPERPPLPTAHSVSWPKNGIDYFVLARLDQAGIEPSPEAEKETLIRRVTLDLTGLPPTPAEVDAFLRDLSPDAYENVVNRLLNSARYGERMALDWLDLARYADTSGYQTDGIRFMWRWRDWVIDAFNRNLPYNQFTLEQLAGDLLPNPTTDQIIATGFNRNHRANSEGGIVFEEYLKEYAVDRVDTTATVWLGLTIGCARCHDHKYDPISQKEFYQLFAYFDQLQERGRVSKYGNSAPLIRAPTARMEADVRDIETKLEKSRIAWDAILPKLRRTQTEWENSLTEETSTDEWVIDGLESRFPLDDIELASEVEPEPATVSDGSLQFVRGKVGKAAQFDGKACLRLKDKAGFGGRDAVSFGVWLRPEDSTGTILALVNEGDTRDNGFSVELVRGKVRVKLGPRWLDDAIRVETPQPIEIGVWQHVLITYDGSQMANGISVYVNGEPRELATQLDILTGGISLNYPLRIGSDGSGNGFHGNLDDVRFYRRMLSSVEAEVLATTTPIYTIAKKMTSERSTGEREKLDRFFLGSAAPEEIRDKFARLKTLEQEKRERFAAIPTVMVMQDRPDPADTFILTRGEYDRPGEKVTAGVPSCLPPLPQGAPANRLGLAQWIVGSSHPLTSRVAVNRFWQKYFGAGLVRTPEDFGTRGESPSHPKLLDWLATEFVRTGWDVKGMQRLIVTSATYRQSSDVTESMLQFDPENRLLARVPRMRLPAETIRDQALSVSGLLDGTIGGPSVNPYQPASLWKEIASDSSYSQDHGPGLYRRSLYTFWKRTVPHPSMAIFDAPSREICTVRRPRTNTPLQALALMNEVTYVEASRVLAGRMLRKSEGSDIDRIRFGFKLLTARNPTRKEQTVLSESLERYRSQYKVSINAARALIGTGEYPSSNALDPGELAAFALVASLMMNLDEVITRE